MLATLLFAAVTAVPAFADAPDKGKDGPPAKKELFAKEQWYQDQKGKEEDFVGVLEKITRRPGVVGFGRMNHYRLVMIGRDNKETIREVYVGGKPALLADYAGMTVKLTGKAVELEVEGRTYHEIWPARLEVVKSAKPSSADLRRKAVDEAITQLEDVLSLKEVEKPGQLKIHAQAFWRYAKADPKGPKAGEQMVLRSAAELVEVTPYKNRDALPRVVEKMATEELAKALKVDGIDWKKQMLLVVTAGVKPTGGYSVDIQSIATADNVAKVTWKLNTPTGFVTQAFTHPGQVALVDRFDGRVEFAQAAAGKPKPGLKVDPSESPANPAKEAEEGKEGGKELKIQARGFWRPGGGRGGEQQQVAIRSGAELVKVTGPVPVGANLEELAKERTAQMAKLLKVDSIDFGKQMLVVVTGGVQRSGGYRVEILSLKARDKNLTVHWKLHTPRPGQPVTLALTHPAEVVLCEKFEGEVKFDPPARKREKPPEKGRPERPNRSPYFGACR